MNNKQQNKIIIAIDGPAASGKGTLAKKIALYLGLKHLDTGKLYRFIAEKIINSKKSFEDLQKDNQLKNDIMAFLKQEISQQIHLNNEKVAKIASILSKKKEIRSFLLPIQREFVYSNLKGSVLDGRDITSVILPNADVKIFVTARAFIRAKRRFQELKCIKRQMYKYIFYSLIQRDIRDTKRTLSPMIFSENALFLDTSYHNKEQIFIEAIKKIKTYLSKL